MLNIINYINSNSNFWTRNFFSLASWLIISLKFVRKQDPVLRTYKQNSRTNRWGCIVASHGKRPPRKKGGRKWMKEEKGERERENRVRCETPTITNVRALLSNEISSLSLPAISLRQFLGHLRIARKYYFITVDRYFPPFPQLLDPTTNCKIWICLKVTSWNESPTDILERGTETYK